MRGIWRKAVTVLSSWWLALGLAVALAALFMLGQTIPQAANAAPWQVAELRERWPLLSALGIYTIYTSPLVIVLFAALCINLAGIMFARLAALVRVERLYAAAGFALLFASGILLVSGLLTGFYTKGKGEAILTASQIFNAKPDEYASLEPPILGRPPAPVFQLIEIEQVSEGWNPGNVKVKLAYPAPSGTKMLKFKGDEKGRLGEVKIGLTEVGLSPRLKLESKAGDVYEDAFVSLKVLGAEEDGYMFPATAYVAKFKFYPDYHKGKFGDTTQSTALKNPAFRVQIYREGQRIKDALLKPGESLEFENMRLYIGGLRLWARFSMEQSRGSGLIGAAVIAGVFGLLLVVLSRWRDPRQSVQTPPQP